MSELLRRLGESRGPLGYCTGCRERFELAGGTVPLHMWPHSAPLMIACSGGGQPPAEGSPPPTKRTALAPEC